MLGQLVSDLPDMTLGEEVSVITAGINLSISPTTAAIMSGRARLIFRDDEVLPAPALAI